MMVSHSRWRKRRSQRRWRKKKQVVFVDVAAAAAWVSRFDIFWIQWLPSRVRRDKRRTRDGSVRFFGDSDETQCRQFWDLTDGLGRGWFVLAAGLFGIIGP